jgi:hypothetical protein
MFTDFETIIISYDYEAHTLIRGHSETINVKNIGHRHSYIFIYKIFKLRIKIYTCTLVEQIFHSKKF